MTGRGGQTVNTGLEHSQCHITLLKKWRAGSHNYCGAPFFEDRKMQHGQFRGKWSVITVCEDKQLGNTELA